MLGHLPLPYSTLVRGMTYLHLRLQLRFLFCRHWRSGVPLHLCTYVPAQISSSAGLVTSDNGTCGNDTIVYTLEQVIHNPRIDNGRDAHIGVLEQFLEQCSCPQTFELIEFLVIFLRVGGPCPLQQGHLRAIARRYIGREDRIGIVGLLDPAEAAPFPAFKDRSQFGQRIDIDVLFMP